MVVKGKKSKNPPIMSHEFVIQNHADIVAVIAMVFMLGLMVEAFHPLASSFIAMSHNMTYPEMGANGQDLVLFRPGPKDMLAVFFYMLIMILVHAVIQEFVLDKVNKKLHLSKVKSAKFNESGQLLAFYGFSFIYAGNLLWESFNPDGGYLKFLNDLWAGYPEQHIAMPWGLKLFYILQLAYWVHTFPELYLTKTKKEDMPAKIQMAAIYLLTITAGYAMHYQRIMLILLSLHYLVEGVFHMARMLYFLDRNQIAQGGFKLWNMLFICVRIVSVVLSVLTFWFGMGRVEAENPDSGSSIVTRSGALSAVCLLQAWMTWIFITFQVRRGKDVAGEEAVKKPSSKAANGTSKKKQ